MHFLHLYTTSNINQYCNIIVGMCMIICNNTVLHASSKYSYRVKMSSRQNNAHTCRHYSEVGGGGGGVGG